MCVSNLANGYNEMLRLHGIGHEEFDDLADSTPPAEDGRLLIPWFTGERTPDLPQATPVFFGFGLDSFTKERLCRAVLDGHVLNLHAAFVRMPGKVEELRLTGGLSRSDAWCQTIADVFEAEVVPVEGEGAALGAAVHAAWVWLEEAGKGVPIEELVETFVVLDHRRRMQPRPDRVEAYRTLKRLFQALSQRLRGLEGEDPFRIRSEML